MMGMLGTGFHILGCRRLRQAGWLVPVLAVMVNAAATQPAAVAGVPEEARDGARLFADSSYKEAADAFRQATIASPDDVRWRYDLGLSEALGQDFENALNNLGATARQAPPEVAGASLYNAGNVHLTQDHFAEAAGAYRQALVRNPDDVEAKHNLELALRKLQEQKQNQSDKQNDSTQNEKQKDKDSESKGENQKQKDQEKKDQKQQDQEDKNQKDDPSQNQNQDSTSQEPPPDPGQQPPSDSTLTREQAERILRALADEEARLRNQVRKAMVLPAPGGKDW